MDAAVAEQLLWQEMLQLGCLWWGLQEHRAAAALGSGTACAGGSLALQPLLLGEHESQVVTSSSSLASMLLSF